ncbi:MAG: TIGR03435 family protein [Acidobacteriota bacterium]|nr:TIGR03435 family protein [Acidobacteriota bacterium]
MIPAIFTAHRAAIRPGLPLGLLLAVTTLAVSTLAQQPSFAVATIRPSSEPVPFEHDGMTETSPEMLRMRDVTVRTCIKWAYGVQDSQISAPDWTDSNHFDITAKADEPVTVAQLKLMLQPLLTERFKLSFHRESRELKAFAMIVAKGGPKVTEADPAGTASHQNSASGMVSKDMSMKEFADYISGPLQKPVVDQSGLPGRYDFSINFAPYLPEDMRTMHPDATAVILAALQGEVGLKLEPRKLMVDVLVIDHVEKPSAN